MNNFKNCFKKTICLLPKQRLIGANVPRIKKIKFWEPFFERLFICIQEDRSNLQAANYQVYNIQISIYSQKGRYRNRKIPSQKIKLVSTQLIIIQSNMYFSHEQKDCENFRLFECLLPSIGSRILIRIL